MYQAVQSFCGITLGNAQVRLEVCRLSIMIFVNGTLNLMKLANNFRRLMWLLGDCSITGP